MRLDQLRRLAARAVANGATYKPPRTVEWDCSGRCLAPITRELFARSDLKREEHWESDKPGADFFRVILHVRCRKCVECRKVRSKTWRDKARREVFYASRTWFGTITLNPEAHTRAAMLARKKLAKQGLDFDALDAKSQFMTRHSETGKLITLYLKRLREQSKAPFRYLLVAEVHKSGLPHYHILVHETDVLKPIPKRQLEAQWPHGFTSWRLADAGTAWYVTKYLTKDCAARVRASIRYGAGVRPQGIDPKETNGTNTRFATGKTNVALQSRDNLLSPAMESNKVRSASYPKDSEAGNDPQHRFTNPQEKKRPISLAETFD